MEKWQRKDKRRQHWIESFIIIVYYLSSLFIIIVLLVIIFKRILYEYPPFYKMKQAERTYLRMYVSK